MQTNPYQTPESPLEVETSHEPVGGSLKGALAGEFQWTIQDVIRESWSKQNGSKLSLWGALLIYYGISFVVGFVLGVVAYFIPSEAAASALTQLILMLVTWPLLAGILMMGIKRSTGTKLRATMVFDYYDKIAPIFLLYLTMSILVVIGFVLLILPGIYLMVAFSLAPALLLEKKLSIWEALETSRKVVSKCWFRIFGLYLGMFVIVMLSAIPLGIGLIWTIPMTTLVFGIVYREIFGVNELTPEL